MDSFTKLKYKEDGEIKQFKNKQNFNLTSIRYGVTARVSVGNVGLFGYYSLTPIFKDGKGPDQADLNNITFGLTLAGF